MNDLRRILESRAAFYSKADAILDTSDTTPEAALIRLRGLLAEVKRKWDPDGTIVANHTVALDPAA